MRIWIAAAIAATSIAATAWAQPTPPQPPQPAAGEAAEVTGRIIDTRSGSPLAGVAVRLGRYPLLVGDGLRDGLWAYTATTNDRGEFTISNMMPDRYGVNATLDGFGLTRGSHRSITVGKGEKASVTLRMFPASVIEGVVEDADRKPLANIGVELLQESWTGGQRNLSNAMTPVWTKEDGRFSIAGVLPGTYYIRATPASSSSFLEALQATNKAPRYAVADTWYPGTTEPESAAPLVVTAGVNQTGLRIEMKPASYYSVSGQVEGLPESARNPRVQFQRLSGSASMDLLGAATPWVMFAGRPIQSDDTFQVENVPPGPYLANLIGARGNTRIEVRDEDVENVRITVTPSWKIAGMVVYEDGMTAGPMMGSTETFDPGRGYELQLFRVDPEGKFTVNGLAAGPYRIAFRENPDAVVRKIQVGGRTFEGGRFEFTGPDTDNVTITVARTGAVVSGSVETEGDPPPQATVTLTPVPLARIDGTKQKTVLLNGTTSFSFRNLEAGAYRACAWSSETGFANILGNPRFEPQLAGDCETVTVGFDGNEQVRLKWLDPSSYK